MMAASLVARGTHAVVPSGRLGQQCAHPDQVNAAAVKMKFQLTRAPPRCHSLPSDRPSSSSRNIADQLAFLLTDRVARMSGRARSIALPRVAVSGYWATCGVTPIVRSWCTKPLVS